MGNYMALITISNNLFTAALGYLNMIRGQYSKKDKYEKNSV